MQTTTRNSAIQIQNNSCLTSLSDQMLKHPVPPTRNAKTAPSASYRDLVIYCTLLLVLWAHAILAEQVEHGQEQTVPYQCCTQHKAHTQSKKQNSIREFVTKRARQYNHGETMHLCKDTEKKHRLLDASVSRSEIVSFSRLHKARKICRLSIVRCTTVGGLLSGVDLLEPNTCSRSWSGGSKRRWFRRGRDAGSKSARTYPWVCRADSSMMGMGTWGPKQAFLLLSDTHSLHQNSCGTLWQGRCSFATSLVNDCGRVMNCHTSHGNHDEPWHHSSLRPVETSLVHHICSSFGGPIKSIQMGKLFDW